MSPSVQTRYACLTFAPAKMRTQSNVLFLQCHDILEQLKDWDIIARERSRPRNAYWHTLCAGQVSLNLTSARHNPRSK